MKYVVFDDMGDAYWTYECDEKGSAIYHANFVWESLSKHDKKRRKGFYVLESVNPDEDAVDHFDGDIIYRIK